MLLGRQPSTGENTEPQQAGQELSQQESPRTGEEGSNALVPAV